MSSAESRAQSIIISELGLTNIPSYQQLRELNFTGYTHAYLQQTANFSNLTTAAKLSVVVKLAKCDQAGIDIFHKTSSQLKHNLR